MWTGVTMGFAGIKFSGSPRSQGAWRHRRVNNKKKRINPNTSFTEKYGWNGLLSKFLSSPRGLEEPVSCRNNKWVALKAARIKGRRKCKVKNRVRVAFLTENPPHSQYTSSCPTKGTAEAKLVITVAPQKDICPQGRTYPKNAVPIKRNRITTPTNQVSLKLKDP